MIGLSRTALRTIVSLAVLFCLLCAPLSARATEPKSPEASSTLSAVILTEKKSSVDVPPDISIALRDGLDEYLYRYQSFLSWPNLKIIYSITQFDPGRASNVISGPSSIREGFIVVDAIFESSGKEFRTSVRREELRPGSIYSAVKECAWKIALHATQDTGLQEQGQGGRRAGRTTKPATERTKKDGGFRRRKIDSPANAFPLGCSFFV
jgi:hypothetical protein